MARTKKEIEEQAPDAEQETTGTESDPVPQTEQDTPPGEVANAGVTDLELAAAKSLDPDAPQTDLESGDDPDGRAAAPQTDPEWDPDSQSESGQETFSSQTDMESADSNAGSQTDPEPAEEPGDGQAFDPTADLGSQTEPETEPDDKASPQSEGDAAAEGDAEPPAPSRRRRASRKKATEAQDGGEDAPAEHPEEEQSDSGQPQKLRMPGRRRQRVVSIDAERTVETDTDRLRNDLLDLVESLKSKKILTGTIQGVERLADNPEMSYAVIYHGDFKVIIPVLEAIEEPADYRGQPKGDVLHYLLNKRLGAEVDYIVKGVDQEHNVVAASRLEAMALKRREYYFRTDRDGNYQIYEGIRAEARVISVIRAGIFVDLFGAECYIPLRELSYQRWVDAAQHYQPGQRVLVRVLEVDRSDRSRPAREGGRGERRSRRGERPRNGEERPNDDAGNTPRSEGREPKAADRDDNRAQRTESRTNDAPRDRGEGNRSRHNRNRRRGGGNAPGGSGGNPDGGRSGKGDAPAGGGGNNGGGRDNGGGTQGGNGPVSGGNGNNGGTPPQNA